MPLPQMHGRTHCPGGSDPIPPDCLTATPPDTAYLFKSTTQTILTDSSTNLTSYDDFLNGTNITADTSTGKFTVSATGIYLFELNVLWSGAFAAGKMARISVAGGGSITQNIGNPSNWCSEQDTGTNDDFVQVHWLVFASDATPSLTFQGQVRQNSGSSQDVSTVDFSVVRLGPY